MIHYNVWFAFKDGIEEGSGLAVIEGFLRELCGIGEASGFRLLRNSSEGARTKLPRFQAIIEFTDDTALSRAMKNQAARGIHQGGHGRIVDVVSEFRVEIFRLLAPDSVGAVQYACEI
jgi:hypothetical protein